MKGSYLGPRFARDDIRARLNKSAAVYQELEDEQLLPILADILAAENVVGWFQGRMEFGPRALGGRSIIGDPRSAKMQSVMNLKIKYRESFRPFAPSVLNEDVSHYFEQDRPSPYMLLVAPVAARIRIPMTAEQEQLFGIEKLNVPRSELPSITHVDYSARIQTVHAETNPRYHALISVVQEKDRLRRSRQYLLQCARRADCRVHRKMPIAVSCAPRWTIWSLRTFLLEKSAQPAVAKDDAWMNEFELD